MQKKGFLLLVGATLVLVMAAIAALSVGDRAASQAPPGERALPGLGPKLADLGRIRLAHGTMKANFTIVDGRWVVVEKGNYPAAAGRIRQLLLGLADLTLVEPKTERPALFARLDLDDPSNGKSTQVTVQDRSGQVVAELIIGRRREDRLGGGNDGIYVRQPRVDRAWLARGSLDLSGDLLQWLDRRMLDMPAARIASVKLTGGDGVTLVLSRAKPDDKFAVAEAPADTKFKPDTVLAEPSGALAALDLADVKPRPDQPVPDSSVATAAFTTFDGLTVDLRLFARDNIDWVAIDASGKDAAEAEAKAINDRLAQWTYAIAADRAKLLRTKLSDLTESDKGS
jgi:hypothetical protein